MIRVLAVDDHAVVRDGIAHLVSTQSDIELLSAFTAFVTPAAGETHCIQVVRGCAKRREIERKESRS